MISFIHTADIHFGMENYGKIDTKTGIHSRLLDFVKALDFCIEYAIEQRIDFFLFCGDAYKTAHPSQTQQRLLFQCLLKLYKAQIPVVLVLGNHDHPLSFGKAHALNLFGELPLDGFFVIDKPTSFVLSTKNGPVQIIGIPWPTRNNLSLSHDFQSYSALQITEYMSNAVSRLITHFAQNLDPQLPAVLAGHLTVSTGIFSGSEKRAIYGTDPVLLPSQLAIPPFDYVALGHLHRYQNLNPHGIPVVYAGSIERVDFGERKEDKGFCHVTVHNKSTSHEFIKTPMRPFVQIEVTITDPQRATEEILSAVRAHTIKDAIVKIIYHLSHQGGDCIDLKAIEQACASAMYVVGIIPIIHHQLHNRPHRTMKAGLDFPSLFNLYCDHKPELQQKKEQLFKKTQLLIDAQLKQQEE